MKEQKHKIRQQSLKRRAKLNEEQKHQLSKKIADKLSHNKTFQNAEKILFYYPIKKEVDILDLIKKSITLKKVYLPKIHKDKKIFVHQIKSLEDLHPGAYNIPEPKQHCPILKASELDLIIIPGVAFDKTGVRIGYGGGYYDRFLKHSKITKIALAYDFQIHENIPGEIHDEKVDIIITETNTIHTNL